MATKRLAIQGALWTVAGVGATHVLRLVSNLILTRLLYPELFGLMALVNSVIIGLHLFSDIGLSTSIVRHKLGGDPAFLDTAWTLQIIRGVGLWLASLVLAYPIAELYDEPRLTWVLPLVGLNALITGFNSTALLLFLRNLAIRQLTTFEVIGQVVSVAVTLAWAYFDPSPWAFVVGGLVAATVQLTLSHGMKHGPRNRFAWEAEAVREFVSFGKWIFFSTAMTFLASQADRLLLGKIFSLEFLGVYVIAVALAEVPRATTLAVSANVIFPAFSRLVEMPRDEFRAKVQRNRGPVLAVIAIGLGLAVGLGDYVVRLLYDARYAAAGWMLSLLALRTWPMMLADTIGPALLSLGNPRPSAVGYFAAFLALVIGVLAGSFWHGPVGAVIGVAASSLPYYIAVTHALHREQLACLGQDLRATFIFVVTIGITFAARSDVGFSSLD